MKTLQEDFATIVANAHTLEALGLQEDLRSLRNISDGLIEKIKRRQRDQAEKQVYRRELRELTLVTQRGQPATLPIPALTPEKPCVHFRVRIHVKG
jgi:hypothetical protein